MKSHSRLLVLLICLIGFTMSCPVNATIGEEQTTISAFDLETAVEVTDFNALPDGDLVTIKYQKGIYEIPFKIDVAVCYNHRYLNYDSKDYIKSKRFPLARSSVNCLI